ncbi:hypothetical protein CALVIDRAFT_534331 [Calocera viscosa TUFC12733]|uniref:Uncharacterized protein n=1 Tax=Calocera viscosa (strain TUFC12733) TaxID=1330018 RepID=A0A167Q326_CALVF|nr:hypothetical protein CALVIDRAFT_534331 [Calocera viscosa TUFC12733]
MALDPLAQDRPRVVNQKPLSITHYSLSTTPASHITHEPSPPARNLKSEPEHLAPKTGNRKT